MTPQEPILSFRIFSLRRRGRVRGLPGHAGLRLFAYLLTALVLVPLVAVIVIAMGSSEGVWPHLVSTVLPRSVRITLLLMAGVAVLSSTMGVVSAWLVTHFAFPGRRILEVALVLPFAMPLYIVAFAYIEFLDFTGPLQSAIRAIGGYTSVREYWSPDVHNLPGAALIMSSVLYPYVYMTTRLLFLMQSVTALQVAQTLGCSRFSSFFRIAVPLARPAIAIGVTLCLMETLNDIGAVDFLGIRTLTFSVYDTWLNRGSLAGAAQIATVMVGFVVLLIVAERAARGRQRYQVARAERGGQFRMELNGWRAAGAAFLCAVPPLLGMGIPAFVLIGYALRRLPAFAEPELLAAAWHSVTVAAATGTITVIAGLVLAYCARLAAGRLEHVALKVALIGYAVPGTVLALGILMPLARLDNAVDAFMRSTFDLPTGLLITGSAAAIVYACSVRFLAVAQGTVEAGLAKITSHLDMAARTLGRTAQQTLIDVHLPLMKKALGAAFLLVFVDSLKELSATLLLRPFNYDTLATLVYSRASRAAYGDAAVPALLIVLVGLIPVIMLLRSAAPPLPQQRGELP
ncbi:ABC transporter permease [Afifella pfennigii]|uniref:ABC transporter permease n=1 Tax=Afifella pfennigii TaxID=209897 RepID=UPI000A5CFF61|nr:iron ABC transporter permease [Afifella pfennigii]